MKIVLLTQFADIIQISSVFYTQFYPICSSINFKQFVNISRKYSTSHNPNIDGVFILMLFNISDNPTAIFLFYSVTKRSILRFKFHKGNSYYRGFTRFMKKTIKNLDENGIAVTNILIPRNFITKSLNKYFKDIVGVSVLPYSRNLNNSLTITDDIKHQIKEIKDLNQLTLEEWVKKFNSYSFSYKGLNLSPLYSFKRMLSSLAPNRPMKNLSNVRRYSYSFDKKDYNYYIQQLNNKIRLNIPLTYKDYTVIPRKHVTLHNIKFIDQKNIKQLLINFRDEVLTLLNNNTHLLSELKLSTQFKVHFEDGTTRTTSAMDTIEMNDLNIIEKSYYQNWLTKHADNYSDLNPIKIIISYRFVPGWYKRKIVSYISDQEIKKSFSISRINKQIPKTMDLNLWGNLILNNITGIYEGIIRKTNLTTHINTHKTVDDKGFTSKFKNIVYIFYKGIGQPITCTDERNYDDDFASFTRTFKNITITFHKGVQVLFKQVIDKVQYISKLKEQSEPKFKFVTMDIETRERTKKNFEPVCISITIPKHEKSKSPQIKKTFTIWEYGTSEKMVIAAFRMLMVRKYYGYSIYFHNFSEFDSVFIFKTLANLPDVAPRIKFRNGKFLTLYIKFDPWTKLPISSLKYKGTFKIYDSLLILPLSLETLGEALNKNKEQKTFFPHKLLNDPSISWDYECEGVPPLKYFHTPDPLNIKKYREFINKYKIYKASFVGKWNLKKELIKYCENDVLVLHNVLTTFTIEIYNKFKLNILKYPTLPSIAFALYRTIFMELENIPIIKGSIYNDIKQAYYGGIVDVYKPFARMVKSFDINSLYPWAMKFCPMPIGKPVYIEGSSLNLDDLFGFVYVKVWAPKRHIPILPYKIKTSSGAITTIYPTGTWEGWYFTEEVRNAIKFGYKFKIFKGYQFKKSYIFGAYVSALYKIKCSSTPDSPWYIISKLLLNSLYGRFGMSPINHYSVIVDIDEVEKFNNDDTIITCDTVYLGDKAWVSYTKLSDDDGDNEITNISVGISAAITAWSRIHMSDYIMKYSDYICYIDTDGIKIMCSIDPKDIGTELGKMKFEGEFKEAVFIAPKLYGGITLQNDMIIKIKGVKNPIPYEVLLTLLSKKNIKILQSKWHKNYSEATIEIIEQIYTLSATENKRELIRDSLGKIRKTRAYELTDGRFKERVGIVLDYLTPTLISELASARIWKESYPKIPTISLRQGNQLYYPEHEDITYPEPWTVLKLSEQTVETLPDPAYVLKLTDCASVLSLPKRNIDLSLPYPLVLQLNSTRVKDKIFPEVKQNKHLVPIIPMTDSITYCPIISVTGSLSILG
jgi:hypothetical protein